MVLPEFFLFDLCFCDLQVAVLEVVSWASGAPLVVVGGVAEVEEAAVGVEGGAGGRELLDVEGGLGRAAVEADVVVGPELVVLARGDEEGVAALAAGGFEEARFAAGVVAVAVEEVLLVHKGPFIVGALGLFLLFDFAAVDPVVDLVLGDLELLVGVAGAVVAVAEVVGDFGHLALVQLQGELPVQVGDCGISFFEVVAELLNFRLVDGVGESPKVLGGVALLLHY
mmetsp:Transcript_5178/g.16961  ORF Transcript_5178/g.16961 Transcript_5178/m.16961 type:complete len:226 (-) Transcript_5178:882-1559(-)